MRWTIIYHLPEVKDTCEVSELFREWPLVFDIEFSDFKSDSIILKFPFNKRVKNYG